VCQLKQLAWGSPSAGTACLRRASCNDPCRLEQRTYISPPLGTAAPAMRLAVLCAYSILTSALLFAPPAASMRLAVRRPIRIENCKFITSEASLTSRGEG
jgi:hypothetical protein